jgi:hypothetical protein
MSGSLGTLSQERGGHPSAALASAAFGGELCSSAQDPFCLAHPQPWKEGKLKAVAKRGHSENPSALSSPLGFGLPQSYPKSYFRKPKLPTVIISLPRDWFSFVPLNALHN